MTHIGQCPDLEAGSDAAQAGHCPTSPSWQCRETYLLGIPLLKGDLFLPAPSLYVGKEADSSVRLWRLDTLVATIPSQPSRGHRLDPGISVERKAHGDHNDRVCVIRRGVAMASDPALRDHGKLFNAVLMREGLLIDFDEVEVHIEQHVLERTPADPNTAWWPRSRTVSMPRRWPTLARAWTLPQSGPITARIDDGIHR